MCSTVKEVVERVTEAVTSWMTVETGTENVRKLGKVVSKCVRPCRKQDSVEKERATNVKFQRRCNKKKQDGFEQLGEAKTLQRVYSGSQRFEKATCPIQRAQKKSEGWKERWQVQQQVQEHNTRPSGEEQVHRARFLNGDKNLQKKDHRRGS